MLDVGSEWLNMIGTTIYHPCEIVTYIQVVLYSAFLLGPHKKHTFCWIVVMLPQLQKNGPIFFLVTCPITCWFQEINAVLGEQLSAEDEEAVMAEFENLEAQVWPTKRLELLSVEKEPKIMQLYKWDWKFHFGPDLCFTLGHKSSSHINIVLARAKPERFMCNNLIPYECKHNSRHYKT